MNELIKYFNKNYGKEYGKVSYPRTTIQIYRVYQAIKSYGIKDEELVKLLHNVKLPKPRNTEEWELYVYCLYNKDDSEMVIDTSNLISKENPVFTGSMSLGRKEGTTVGEGSYAVGASVTASGAFSHAEGFFTDASGSDSHAEGYSTKASGSESHAEGFGAKALGSKSHAEGFNTTASGQSSHAEGVSTSASGDYSHVEGCGTIALGDYQHVQGKYNIKDTKGKYAHIVGNGSDADTRSNAHTLDWDGNAWYAGKLSQEGTPTDSKDLITKKYFDSNIPKSSDLTDYAKKTDLPKKASDVGADATGTAVSKVNEHNTSASSHSDIRSLITNLTTKLNTLADSDDTTLDQLSEIVAYIKNNKSLIDGVTTSKLNISDVADNLTTNITNKALSAKQGVELKKLIDAITVPTKVSQLTNDSKFLTSVPAEYITEDELNTKGYLTKHQDISGKVDKVEGKGLSTVDFTTAYETKLKGLSNYNDTIIKNDIQTINTQLGDIANTGKLTDLNTTEKSSIIGAINEVFQNASNGKTLIAQAITGKGVTTSADATYQTMATNIKNIQTVSDASGIIFTLNNKKYKLSKNDKGEYIATLLTYSVTSNLTHCTLDNTDTSIDYGNKYTCNISVNKGFIIGSAIITMGGTDVTSTVLKGNIITINSVTGDVIITVNCVEEPANPVYGNI